MSEKLLHKKRISELKFYNKFEAVNRHGVPIYHDIEDLKQWAIAIVKEYFSELKDIKVVSIDDMNLENEGRTTFEEISHPVNSYESHMASVASFLIDRFEIRESDLE